MVKAALFSLEHNILECVEEMKENYPIDFIIMKVIEPQEAMAAVYEAEESGADVILAYGLQMLVTDKIEKPPVVNIVLSGHDVGILLRDAKMQSGLEKPAIALLVYSCMFRRSLSLGEMLGVGLRIYMLDEFSDNAAAVAKAAEDGVDMIIGVRDVAALAEARGIPALHIFSGREGVTLALRNLEVLTHTIEMEKKSAAEKDAFMNSIFHGIIEVNLDGEIVSLNDYAKNLLDCKNRNIVGQPLLNYFPRKIKDDLEAVLKTGQQVFTLDIKLLNKNMITNIEPVISGSEINGAVITMQKGHFVQTIPETQSKVVSRGFKATHRFGDFDVRSASYENLIRQAKLAATSNAPVLIFGEEGTETLRLAQCIHNESSRRRNGFIDVECSAWESERLEEMLFGIKNPASEEDDTCSLVELAEEGTLFLSHIDALTNELQFRICRLIRGVLPLRDNRQVFSNIRVIASTGKDLNELMNQGKFRNDLYYALNVLSLDIPPLRARKDDLEAWIDYFLDHYCTLYSRPIQLSRGACRCMCEYDWPGNIRQLENFCHKIVLLTPRRNIDEAFVRNRINQLYQITAGTDEQEPVTTCQDENAMRVLEALKQHDGNRAKTAKELGISKTTLWRLMQKYGITTGYTV